MNKPLTPFYDRLIKEAQAKKALKKPAKSVDEKKVPKKSEASKASTVLQNKMKIDVAAKKLSVGELQKKYPTLQKTDILENVVDQTKGGTESYKKYLKTVAPHIGAQRTNVDTMMMVYAALRDSGLPSNVIEALKDEWFGDEGNIDWTHGGDGMSNTDIDSIMEQIHQQQSEHGVSTTNTMDSPGGIYAGNMPFSGSDVPEGLAEEAAKIKKRRESMKQPEKDIANRYINREAGEKADVLDSHVDQGLYERGIDNLRKKMSDLGL